jgi:hypothetical protein
MIGSQQITILQNSGRYRTFLKLLITYMLTSILVNLIIIVGSVNLKHGKDFIGAVSLLLQIEILKIKSYN